MSNSSKHPDESQWLPVSDLMAGLMMVFVFIAISLMRHAYIERDKVQDIAVIYVENQKGIYDALNKEFKEDLSKWDAVIDTDTLTFTFQSPDVLFPEGKSQLNNKFKNILNEFFPRYLNVLLNECFVNSKSEEVCFRESIDEVRIEGHTSSVWNNITSADEAYFENMRLSQERTRSVLNYIYHLGDVKQYSVWIKKHIAAVGLSSSHLVFTDNKCLNESSSVSDCQEDEEKSRRVTFRIITNADVQIKSILN